MAEYLTPGVYIEERDFRSSTIEGVSTTTSGFVGPCGWGPAAGTPTLVTSFEEFQRQFGGLEPLNFAGTLTTNYLAFAVRAFFDNGGKRCYIARIENGAATAESAAPLFATVGGSNVMFRARFPGFAGNVSLTLRVMRSANVVSDGALRGVRPGDMLEAPAAPATAGEVTSVTLTDLRAISVNTAGEYVLTDSGGASSTTIPAQAYRLTLQVTVTGQGREEVYANLSPNRSSADFIGRVMRTEDVAAGIEPPYDRTARVWLDVPTDWATADEFQIVQAFTTTSNLALQSGTDGDTPTPNDYRGVAGTASTGLEALAEVEDIALVAAPAAWSLTAVTERHEVRDLLITHCENLKYRFAILADAASADVTSIRDARSKHDTTYAGLYYPWVVVSDPFGASGETLELPPDGYVAGIFARSDIETGVHKAPANEPVRGILRFNRNVTEGQQGVLNPEGINCLRFFEGRGNLVWGARTMSSDPLWKYVNVRRLFIYLEHSIDRATQWAVFEPNNHTLWLKVRLTIEAFLKNVHTTGALLGKSPEEAFFVKCDRTTMSLSDLDNGRLVCLVGVAPTRPAEFVIFRIGQWTAEASLI